MLVDCPAKFHHEKIPNKYHTASKSVITGMVRHFRLLLAFECNSYQSQGSR